MRHAKRVSAEELPKLSTVEMISICERPPEAKNRATPGHLVGSHVECIFLYLNLNFYSATILEDVLIEVVSG
jgi:hypothetical protein